MKKIVITDNDIYRKFSEGKICVFIKDIGDPEDETLNRSEKLMLEKTEDYWFEYLMVEFSDVKEADDYVMSFRGKWLNVYYVSSWMNGEFQSENT